MDKLKGSLIILQKGVIRGTFLVYQKTSLNFPGACLKKAFRELRVPLCGRFYPNEGGLSPLQQPNEGKIYRKVGLADCGNDFSDTL